MKRYVCIHGYKESEVGAFYMRDEVDTEMARLKAELDAAAEISDAEIEDYRMAEWEHRLSHGDPNYNPRRDCCINKGLQAALEARKARAK